MNFLLNWPMEMRMLALGLLGCFVGQQVNRGIYRLAYHARAIGPWSHPAPGVPPRSWFDFVPVFGWLGLSRESPVHGTGYWVRPMLMEMAVGGLFAWWYWQVLAPLGNPNGIAAPLVDDLHARYAAQIALLCLMLVATFIDFDEQNIPDSIAVNGTLLGLLFAGLLPMSLLPLPGNDLLLLTSPYLWDVELDGPAGLAVGCFCFVGWVLAVLPKTWFPRRGLATAVRYLLASAWRWPGNVAYVYITAIGLGYIALVWSWGGLWWQGLLTSLVGMTFGGGLVWAVRIAASHALQREALGFGDVTLLCMIGSFLGWQPSVLVFFLAPMAGLIIAVINLLITRRHDLAYGPYLCLAAVVLMVEWPWVWEHWAAEIFVLGWYLPILLAVCVFMVWLLLTLWRPIGNRLRGETD